MTLGNFEVGGTVTTGVRIFHLGCRDWFIEWSSRDRYPSIATMVEACESHECTSDVEGGE